MKAKNTTVQVSSHKEIVTPLNTSLTTHAEIKSMKTEIEWKLLVNRPLAEQIASWLSEQTKITQRNYASGMRQLSRFGYIDLNLPLQAFSLVNYENVLAQIKTDSLSKWSQCTRQARAACFISLTSYLARKYPAIFRKALPNKSGGEDSKTFYKVHKKVASNALTKVQWTAFLHELDKINPRNALVAKLCLGGAKRISEVLSLTTSGINWSENKITFKQLKARGSKEFTVITFAPSLMFMLKGYIGDREGLVFVSRTGKRMYPQYIAKSFALAGERAGISFDSERSLNGKEQPFQVHAHNLRTSAITELRTLGFSDSDVMKMSGHASSEMVNAYDKSSLEDNASKKVNLVV